MRSAVLLGCTPEEAHDLAQTTLVRCYTAWDKVRRADDRDAYVYRMLLNCHRDGRRRRWWGERPTETLPDRAVADFTSGVDVVDAVQRALGVAGTGSSRAASRQQSWSRSAEGSSQPRH